MTPFPEEGKFHDFIFFKISLSFEANWHVIHVVLLKRVIILLIVTVTGKRSV